MSKPGVQAVGLYASLVGDGLPAWHGSHTTNYNTQQTHWTPHTSNHIELAEPYERPIPIESTAGGTLRVLSPWQRTSVLCPETGAPSATLEADPCGIITLDTRPGERIVLTESPPE